MNINISLVPYLMIFVCSDYILTCSWPKELFVINSPLCASFLWEKKRRKNVRHVQQLLSSMFALDQLQMIHLNFCWTAQSAYNTLSAVALSVVFWNKTNPQVPLRFLSVERTIHLELEGVCLPLLPTNLLILRLGVYDRACALECSLCVHLCARVHACVWPGLWFMTN